MNKYCIGQFFNISVLTWSIGQELLQDFIFIIILFISLYAGGLTLKSYRFLKLFNPRWYVKNFGWFQLMTSFHEVFPAIVFTRSRQDCFACFKMIFAIFPIILFNVVIMVESTWLLLS